MIDFLTARAQAWAAMVGAPHMIATIAFLCLLLVIDCAHRGWRLSWTRRTVDGVLATLSLFHFNFLFVPLVWVGSEKVKELYALAHVPSIPTEAWSSVPVWVLIPVAVLAHDFSNYCIHRLLHLPWLWPIHAIHHSDPDVTGLTAYRIHILEGLLMWVSYTVLLTWLGLPDNAIGIGAVFVTLHNIYVHINIDWHHGPFRLLLSSPRFHRWHHADVPEAHGKNLANVCPLWDRLFGTYYCPGPCVEQVGAAGVPENDVVRLILWPWQEWSRMVCVQCAALIAPLRAPAAEPPQAKRGLLEKGCGQ